MITRAYISLGSNINPAHHIQMAIAAFEQSFDDVITSSLYTSEALGFDGPPFVNCVLGLNTTASAVQLLEQCQQLEKNLVDRHPSTPSFCSRQLDIDLLLFGDMIHFSSHLQLPRSDIIHYPFVLGPLAEIAPDTLHPTLQLSFATLWTHFNKTFCSIQRVIEDARLDH